MFSHIKHPLEFILKISLLELLALVQSGMVTFHTCGTADILGVSGVLFCVMCLFSYAPSSCMVLLKAHLPLLTQKRHREGNFFGDIEFLKMSFFYLHSHFTDGCWVRCTTLRCRLFLLGILRSIFHYLGFSVTLEKVKLILIPYPFVVMSCFLPSGIFFSCTLMF